MNDKLTKLEHQLIVEQSKAGSEYDKYKVELLQGYVKEERLYNKSGMLNKAIIIATKSHRNQIDKAGENYILHPLKVMLKCQTLEEKIVAILHDTIEDTDITYDFLINEGFNQEIIDALNSVTHRDNETYFDFIRRCKQNPIAKVVKLADLEDNMDLSRIPNPTEKDYSRLKRYEKAKGILLEEE